MSTCAYIVRKFDAPEMLKQELIDFVTANQYGLFWSIQDPCLTCNDIVCSGDFVFTISDSFVFHSCDLILNRDDEPYAWSQPPMRLPERMRMVESVSRLVLRYADEVELVFCDDNATPADLTRRKVSCDQVAKTLLQEYDDLCEPTYNAIMGEYVVDLASLPMLHLFIHK